MQLVLKAAFFLLSALLEVLWLVLYPFLYIFLSKKHGRERLGNGYPKEKFEILIHAASVGEINGIKPLLLKLMELYPDYRILLTVNTTTGRKVGSTLHPAIHCIISPLDIIHLRMRQMKLTRPRLIMIAETEIWPALLYASKIHQIPMVFINARISEKTVRRYLQVKPLLDWLSTSVRLVCTQTDKDTRRFQLLFGDTQHPALEYNTAQILTCGNLKYAAQLPAYEGGELRKAWDYQDTDKIIVIGSSRPGEEALLLNCFDALITEIPNLKLIIAPRHLNRMDEIRNLLKNKPVSYFSQGADVNQIHIIDELGHLLPAYALADIAIIGGSYFPFGGHNPLEAAFYGKTIMMGEYHQSCLDSVKSLLANEAIVINDAGALEKDIKEILTNQDKYKLYGSRAKAVMNEKNQSLNKHLEQINRYLS